MATLFDEVGLCSATPSDVQAIEHFADCVLRDDFFFRKGHWLSLLHDSRVRLFTVHVRCDGKEAWSEICGIVVLYCDSVLHNLFLSRPWRECGLGSLVVDSLAPTRVRVKTDMKSGDPTGFYERLGFVHEEHVAGRRNQIRVLSRLTHDADSEESKPSPDVAVSDSSESSPAEKASRPKRARRPRGNST